MQHPEEDYYTELHIKDETPETIERNLYFFTKSLKKKQFKVKLRVEELVYIWIVIIQGFQVVFTV